MRILVLTRYERLGSSSRVRFYQYFPYLEAHGVDLINVPFFDDKYVRNLYSGRKTSLAVVLKGYVNRLISLTRKKDINLIWVEKEFLPWFPFEIESLFLSINIPYVVDYDDAVFHRYDMHPNPLVRKILGNKIDRVMSNAGMVIAGNDYIAERSIKAGASNIEILPSVVDVSQYEVKQPDGDKIFKIGWIGSPVTTPFLSAINDTLHELIKESEIRLVLVGAGDAYHFPDAPVERVSWTEDIELSINQKFDVGIMPLPDEPFARGKCGYKLIQYMAGGLPVIASPVGVNQQIVEPGINGYLATTTDEWLIAFRSLRDDFKLRKMMGMAGRKKAESLYNFELIAPKLLEILMGTIKKQI